MACLGEFLSKIQYSIEDDTILREETMILVLQWLMIYALLCMAYTGVVVVWGFDVVLDRVPPGTRYGVLIVSLILVVLISPLTFPGEMVGIIKKLWREIIDQCRSLDEDRQ